jgi:hypothetical protein
LNIWLESSAFCGQIALDLHSRITFDVLAVLIELSPRSFVVQPRY